MKKNPKVSIIIPVYNGAQFIEEAINSALNQTYDNIEIIVINDGSNDNGETKKIVSSFGNKIRYYEKKNGGVASALNFALKKMKGDYFSWLSHDDRYYSNKIERQLIYLSNYDDKTVIYSDYDFMDDKSHVFSVCRRNHKELVNKPELSILRGAIDGITLLIPKKAFIECGEFNEGLICTQDYDMWFRMMKKYKFIHQPEVLATTRLHANQTTNKNPNVVIEGNILWKNIVEGFPDNVKKHLSGTVYNYYLEMLSFINNSPYKDVKEYLENKVKLIENDFQNQQDDILISVIIPCNNNEKGLNDTIISVLEQSHQKLEIILVNYGVKEINNIKIKNNNTIKIFNIKQKSKYFAMNIGIEKASGEFITFLEPTNTYKNNKLQNQLVNMIISKSDFSFTQYDCNKTEPELEDDYFNYLDAKPIQLVYNNIISISTVMIRKKFIDQYNLKFNFNITAEQIFYLDCFKYAKPFVVEQCLSNVFDDSIVKDKALEIKNIINYLINDDFYTGTNEDIAYLCAEYYYFVTNEKLIAQKKDFTNQQLLFDSTFKRKNYFKLFMKKGPFYCIKRAWQKLINVLNKNGV